MTAPGRPSSATIRNRILARYARVLIAAHARGEITAEEVYRRGLDAGARVLTRYPDPAADVDVVFLPAELTELALGEDPPGAWGPTPDQEEGWDAREEWIRSRVIDEDGR